MTIGIVGLGLIGGSMAKAFKYYTEHTVLGADADSASLKRAILTGAADGELTDENVSECDTVIIALYPEDTVNFVKNNASRFKKGALVTDCCGVKQYVCKPCFDAAVKHGFCFLGGHPMAGTQFSGFKNAKENMFKNSYMIIVPPDSNTDGLKRAEALFTSVGFKGITVTDAATHDRMIAYTSQLAHVVSNAYVKSPAAQLHTGFSAGSFKDLTRVAKLNEEMWTELFMDNAEFLTEEIDNIICEMKKYSDAIKNRNYAELKELLKKGRELKESSEQGEKA